jgi:glycosyl transferase, family 25
MRPIRVISLARQQQRRADFLRRNAHVPYNFFDAVDSHTLSAEQIRSSGLFAPELDRTYNAHSYAAAMSHWHLWNEAAASDATTTIAEDDALFRHDFEARSETLLAALPGDWDLVLWGWNFDSVLCIWPIGNVSPAVVLFDEPRLRESPEKFQEVETPVQAFRLERAFGSMAYTLSPAGAAKMLDLCFPQRGYSVWIPVFDKYLPNVGIDVSMNAAYPKIGSFACFPPLAVTPNVRGEAA